MENKGKLDSMSGTVGYIAKHFSLIEMWTFLSEVHSTYVALLTNNNYCVKNMCGTVSIQKIIKIST